MTVLSETIASFLDWRRVAIEVERESTERIAHLTALRFDLLPLYHSTVLLACLLVIRFYERLPRLRISVRRSLLRSSLFLSKARLRTAKS